MAGTADVYEVGRAAGAAAVATGELDPTLLAGVPAEVAAALRSIADQLRGQR